jgi:hypothetical protein
MEAKKTSRRRLLGMSAATAGAATIAVADGWMVPARAADGDPVLLATTNQANNPTVIEIVDSGQAGLVVRSRTDGGSLVGENSSNDGYGIQASGEYIGLVAVGGQTAVYGVSDHGTATRALTYDGIALSASTAVDAGLALEVKGAVSFSRSGRVNVPAGARSVTVPVNVRATTTAQATIQNRQPGVSIEAAVPSLADRTLTIWLTRAAKTPTTVAWFLLD